MAGRRPLLLTFPETYEVEHEDDSAIVSIAIADTFTQIVTVDCTLSAYEENVSEFTFPITVSPMDSAGEPPFQMYDPREARPCIPDECRGLVAASLPLRSAFQMVELYQRFHPLIRHALRLLCWNFPAGLIGGAFAIKKMTGAPGEVDL